MRRSLGVGVAAIVLFLSFAGRAAEPVPVQLSPDARKLIAPVFEAFRDLEKELDALPPPRDDAERLIRMGRIDQEGRTAYSAIDFTELPEEQRLPAFEAAYAEIDKHDLDNQAKLQAMLPPEGWFLPSAYGAEASEAAWLIVQHAVRRQPDIFRAAFQAMERLLPTGEIDKQRFAMMSDRIAMLDGRYQIYGSQMVCHGGRWVPYPLDDLAHVDDRRRSMGFDTTLSENLAQFEGRSCPQEWTGQLPPGARL